MKFYSLLESHQFILSHNALPLPTEGDNSIMKGAAMPIVYKRMSQILVYYWHQHFVICFCNEVLSLIINFAINVSRWLDKLGLAARMRHEVVIRQTFTGGNYALLNNDLDPNPVCMICQLK